MAFHDLPLRIPGRRSTREVDLGDISLVQANEA
jgi:hypothetical protein